MCQQVRVRFEAPCPPDKIYARKIKALEETNQMLKRALNRQVKKTAALRKRLTDAGLKAHTCGAKNDLCGVEEELSQQLDSVTTCEMLSAHEEMMANQSSRRPAAGKAPKMSFIASVNTSCKAKVGSAEDLSTSFNSSETSSTESEASSSDKRSIKAVSELPNQLFNKEFSLITAGLELPISLFDNRYQDNNYECILVQTV